jgi:hypothetical protein
MYSLIQQGYAASGGEFDPKEIQLTGWAAWSSTKKHGGEAWGFYYNAATRDSFKF